MKILIPILFFLSTVYSEMPKQAQLYDSTLCILRDDTLEIRDLRDSRKQFVPYHDEENLFLGSDKVYKCRKFKPYKLEVSRVGFDGSTTPLFEIKKYKPISKSDITFVNDSIVVFDDGTLYIANHRTRYRPKHIKHYSYIIDTKDTLYFFTPFNRKKSEVFDKEKKRFSVISVDTLVAMDDWIVVGCSCYKRKHWFPPYVIGKHRNSTQGVLQKLDSVNYESNFVYKLLDNEVVDTLTLPGIFKTSKNTSGFKQRKSILHHSQFSTIPKQDLSTTMRREKWLMSYLMTNSFGTI